MSATGRIQGHRVTWTGARWKFDDGTPVSDRPSKQPACKACGLKPAILVLRSPSRGMEPVDVDACIAPIVQALNDGGIETRASCCGHGHRPGDIVLQDGRELVIAPDWETARAIDRKFPDIHGERPK